MYSSRGIGRRPHGTHDHSSSSNTHGRSFTPHDPKNLLKRTVSENDKYNEKDSAAARRYEAYKASRVEAGDSSPYSSAPLIPGFGGTSYSNPPVSGSNDKLDAGYYTPGLLGLKNKNSTSSPNSFNIKIDETASFLRDTQPSKPRISTPRSVDSIDDDDDTEFLRKQREKMRLLCSPSPSEREMTARRNSFIENEIVKRPNNPPMTLSYSSNIQSYSTSSPQINYNSNSNSNERFPRNERPIERASERPSYVPTSPTRKPTYEFAPPIDRHQETTTRSTIADKTTRSGSAFGCDDPLNISTSLPEDQPKSYLEFKILRAIQAGIDPSGVLAQYSDEEKAEIFMRMTQTKTPISQNPVALNSAFRIPTKPQVEETPEPDGNNLDEEVEKPLETLGSLKADRERVRLQLSALEKLFAKTQQQEADLKRNKARMREGHRDPKLAENLKLQQDVKMKIEACRNKLFDIEKKVKALSKDDDNKPDSLEMELLRKLNNPLGSTANDDDDEEGEFSGFEYYDPGSHWCRECDLFSSTKEMYLEHLQTKEHWKNIEGKEKPWKKSVAPKKNDIDEENASAVPLSQPIRGIQFFMPVKGYYCPLCKTFAGDNEHAEIHLKSMKHNRAYSRFLMSQPNYEHQWSIDKGKALQRLQMNERKRKTNEDKDERERELKRRREEEREKKEKERREEKEKQKQIKKENKEDYREERKKETFGGSSSNHKEKEKTEKEKQREKEKERENTLEKLKEKRGKEKEREKRKRKHALSSSSSSSDDDNDRSSLLKSLAQKYSVNRTRVYKLSDETIELIRSDPKLSSAKVMIKRIDRETAVKYDLKKLIKKFDKTGGTKSGSVIVNASLKDVKASIKADLNIDDKESNELTPNIDNLLKNLDEKEDKDKSDVKPRSASKNKDAKADEQTNAEEKEITSSDISGDNLVIDTSVRENEEEEKTIVANIDEDLIPSTSTENSKSKESGIKSSGNDDNKDEMSNILSPIEASLKEDPMLSEVYSDIANSTGVVFPDFQHLTHD